MMAQLQASSVGAVFTLGLCALETLGYPSEISGCSNKDEPEALSLELSNMRHRLY